MKYQIEYCPNPDCIQIHVKQRLIRGSILCFEFFDIGDYDQKEFAKEAVNPDGLVSFCKVVSELDGMENDISFGRYEIQMLKASSIFSWNDVLPYVLDALKTFIASDGKLEELAMTKHPTKAYLESLRGQGCDV